VLRFGGRSVGRADQRTDPVAGTRVYGGHGVGVRCGHADEVSGTQSVHRMYRRLSEEEKKEQNSGLTQPIYPNANNKSKSSC